MTAADALYAACLAAPDDDLTRLAYADAVDDAGDDAYAAFVRAQVELARLPDWSPAAAAARHRHPELVTGEPFRDRMPVIENAAVRWAAEPFRRGLGWAVAVSQLADLLAAGDALFAAAPVGELHLPTAPRDHWLDVTKADWLAKVRTVRFTGLSLPIEPVRLLGEVPGGITELRFDQANSPAAPELFGGLARSPLGRQLTALHLRNGYAADVLELIEELEQGLRPERLSLRMVGLTADTAGRLAAGPLLDAVTDLDLSHNQYFGDAGVRALAPPLRQTRLKRLTLSRVGAADGAVRWLTWAAPFAGLEALDLSDNRLGPEALAAFARDDGPAGLRSLTLAHCGVTDAGLKALTRAAFWPSLVELDLRYNEVTSNGVRHLLEADRPVALVALRLDHNPVGEAAARRLRERFGPAAVVGEA